MKWKAEKGANPSGRFRFHSIFARVLSLNILLTVFVIMLSGVVSYLLVRQYITVSNMNELAAKAEQVTQMVAKPGGKMRVLTASRLEEIQNLSDARIIYVDANMVAQRMPVKRKEGAAKLESDEQDMERLEVISALDQELIRSILDGHTAMDVRRLEMLGSDIVFAGAPILASDGSSTGAVILYRLLEDIQNVSFSIFIMMVLAAMIAVLLAVALAWILSGRITQPLKALNATAKRMARGHYGERVQVSGDDEIGQLGTTLNLLSQRLVEVIQNLSDEKSKLEQILSGIGEGIVAVNRQGEVVHHNGAALELLELSAWQMREDERPLDQQDQLVEMLKQTMQTGENRRTTWKSGSGRSIAAIVSPILNEGQIIGSVGLLRDVSEAERMEQMQRDYVANISHELRTPLTGIRGMVEPLMDGLMETEEERMECYQVIYQETMRLQKLIGEMLDMSRLQGGKIKLELEPLELMGVMQSAARRLRERASESQVELTVEETPLPFVMGEEDRILQVLIILLDNALSFTPPGGTVKIYGRRENDRVWVGVKDSGAGIDPMDLPYIWERFYKADRSRMRTSGTGLGLAIAKQVVALMNGEITVKSEPGKGATFEFCLRVAFEEDSDR